MMSSFLPFLHSRFVGEMEENEDCYQIAAFA
jgi:hypothetical protein